MSDLNHCIDPGFGRKVAWDIDLLGGYEHEFIDVNRQTSTNSFFRLRLKRGFGAMLRDRGVRALWIQGWQVAAYWQAVWEARRMGVEVWLRGDTTLRSSGEGGLQAMKRRVLGHLLRRVDRCLYVGEANRQFYLAQGVQAERMLPAPHCIDNDRFAAQAAHLRRERQKLRRQWRIPEEAFCVLFVGKLIQQKRPADLVAAVHGLQKNRSKCPLHILFVGTGQLEHELRQACTIAFDIEEHRSHVDGGGPPASFAGFLNQTEVSRAYVAADCLVLPSASETWGLVVNEAMASGLPCVTSNACGCVEDLILPIGHEFSYPVGDISRLQKCLEVVMARPPSSDRLKAHIDGYDYLRTVETAEQLYAQAVKRLAPTETYI
jgi:glycosyltransferase involved in cell wall biosynthesis